MKDDRAERNGTVSFDQLDEDHYCCVRVGRDLTHRAYEHLKAGRSPPLMGREQEIRDLLALLSRPGMRNIMILGPSGCGKTALAEGLAWKIASGTVPPALRRTRIISTSFGNIWSYTGDSDNWAAYLKNLGKVVEECTKLPAILFMDEIHLIFGHRYSIQYLLPRLSEGELTIVGATTNAEYLRSIEPYPAVARRFHLYHIKEPPPEAVVQMILKRIKHIWPWPGWHKPPLSPAVARFLVNLSDTYMPFAHHPAKAFQLLDQVVARKAMAEDQNPIDKQDIRMAVASALGIPIETITAPALQLRAMENVLNAHILGQQEAIGRLCRRLLIARAGTTVHGDRPQGVFLLAGPTGVGKTELAKALAAYLNGSDRDLVRLDMATYATEGSIYALLGTPMASSNEDPTVPVFTRMIKEHPYGVLLLDEVEKAHRSVMLLFLHAFDTGRMVDILGNIIDLRQMTILMTTNVGFSARQPVIPTPGLSAEEQSRQEEAATLKMIREHFPPEFLGRVDEILCFRPLTRQVMKGFIGQKIRRLEQATGKRIHLEEAAMSFLCEKAFHPDYGARDLNRAMDSLLGHPLALLKFENEEAWERIAALRVHLAPSGQALTVSVMKKKRGPKRRRRWQGGEPPT
uniref:ATP-dependent Clp protease ATP-binding subunit n=1 Tax=Desulfacinum infernum TaxID=35837 RepID=A0A831ZXD0_9BACT